VCEDIEANSSKKGRNVRGEVRGWYRHVSRQRKLYNGGSSDVQNFDMDLMTSIKRNPLLSTRLVGFSIREKTEACIIIFAHLKAPLNISRCAIEVLILPHVYLLCRNSMLVKISMRPITRFVSGLMSFLIESNFEITRISTFERREVQANVNIKDLIRLVCSYIYRRRHIWHRINPRY